MGMKIHQLTTGSTAGLYVAKYGEVFKIIESRSGIEYKSSTYLGLS